MPEMDVFAEDWVVKESSDLECNEESMVLKDWFLARKESSTDSFMWLKLCAKSPFERVNLGRIAIESNARFVELYYVQDTTVEYLTTMRGGATQDKFVFGIEHKCPLQFNQLHLKFLSVKNHSPEQVTSPSVLELKIRRIEVGLVPSSFNVSSAPLTRAGSVRSNSGATDESASVESGGSNQDTQGDATRKDSPGPNQRMDPRQMLLLSMNKPSIPSINFGASPQSNEQLIQLMLQMKTSLISDIGALLDTKLQPIVSRLDKLEQSVADLRNR